MYCQKNQFLITGESATDATNTPTSRVLLNTRGGGGYSGFAVSGMRRMFWGFEMLHFGIFLGRKSLASIFFVYLDVSRHFWGVFTTI